MVVFLTLFLNTISYFMKCLKQHNILIKELKTLKYTGNVYVFIHWTITIIVHILFDY
jgi:hypothetical protein